MQTWGVKINGLSQIKHFEQVIEDREFPIILEEHVPGPNLSVFLGKRQGSQLERRSLSRTVQNVLDLFQDSPECSRLQGYITYKKTHPPRTPIGL